VILSARERLLFGLTLGAVVLMLGDSYLVTPFLERYRTTTEALVKAEADLEAGTELVFRKDEFVRRWRWIRLERGILDADVSREQAAVTFLGLLRRSAEAESLKLENVQPVRGASANGDGEERVIIELKLRCPLHQLSRLLYRLGAAKEITRVDGLRITRASASDSDLNAVVRVSMAVFRDPDLNGKGRNGKRMRRVSR
jgi:hypothetical protein